MGLQDQEAFGAYCGVKIGVRGRLPEAMSSAELAARLDRALDTQSRVLDFSEDPSHQVTISAIDGAGPAYQESFTIDVNEPVVPNEPPTGFSHGDLEVTENATGSP